ncbi:MAG: DNA cytosine methyltransferase [Acidimicrobiia bacterium]|nr:DNA cytosine methyltransferase [Acidimicrobiia bacterium]MYB24199.1 DNA cytosine methyltransferase [Acidimicrobiia bacterium]MYJ14623.1 DNA cytosine methyltransferase [Acidimicrobiia bacterium]
MPGEASSTPLLSAEGGVKGGAVTRRIRSIDLFAGAGGLTLGFDLANAEQGSVRYDPVLAVEHDAAAALTYKTNFGVSVFDGDIEAVDPATYPEAELILGGPPCQGFSPLGRDRDDRSRRVLNSLWEHFLDSVVQVRPLAFVIENVPEFQKSAEFAELRLRMASHGMLSEYDYAFGVLNAADYGVPQRRRRGILVAIRGRGEVPWPPPPTHGDTSLLTRPYRTVREAIADLPPIPTTDMPVTRNGTQDLHIRRNPRRSSLERYRVIPEGGNRFDLQRSRPDLTPPCWLNKPTGTTDVMGRLWWDRPAYTIRTEFYKPEKGRYLHPSQHRPITHREAARLQTFPDDFIFEGTKIEIARQIGNAVPPILARAIALHLAPRLV